MGWQSNKTSGGLYGQQERLTLQAFIYARSSQFLIYYIFSKSTWHPSRHAKRYMPWIPEMAIPPLSSEGKVGLTK